MINKKFISYSLMKYVRPVWYFHLEPYNKSNNAWIDYEQLSEQERELIQYDKNYSSTLIINWDASYQALMKGIIKHKENKTDNSYYIDGNDLFPADIYRFIRKYHKKIWLYFTFIQRLCSLCNPIGEFTGLWQTRNVPKYDLFQTHYNYDKYSNYDSSLIKSNPFLSIIIPTYNRYEALNNLLEDLQKQIYTNFEVIVIDQSNPFNEELYNEFDFYYQIIRQEKPALWRGRNRGIKSAKSEYILFLDDDSRIQPNWIIEHLKCVDYFNVDISSGVSISRIGAKVPENYSFFRLSDQLDTGNVLIKKKVFEECGLFDEQFEKMRMGDGEFGVRSYLNGFKNISNPKASRKHLKLEKGGLRDMGSWDGFRPTNILQPRPVPSILYYWRNYWGDQSAKLGLLQSIPFSLNPYKLKGSAKGNILSILLFIILFPFILSQIIISWRISNRMIKVGDKIPQLNSKIKIL